MFPEPLFITFVLLLNITSYNLWMYSISYSKPDEALEKHDVGTTTRKTATMKGHFLGVASRTPSAA